jgi:hypothetical protein
VQIAGVCYQCGAKEKCLTTANAIAQYA